MGAGLCVRLGARLGLGLGLGALGVCLELDASDGSAPSHSRSRPSVQRKGASTSLPLTSSRTAVLSAGKAVVPPARQVPTSDQGHPALRHNGAWREAFYVHHPDAQDEDEPPEVSQILVLAAMLALLHVAMCFIASGYWCLNVWRDFGKRQQQEGTSRKKAS
eukprot:TRINITY_DN67454_c0_g1_i1.p1 TRINITY_DN67454_c0_g1~~TRINITY_DN67454_c0_g1_i1.p1  ORF type:complete len:162 (+),score=31.11 TRINITY_DN67454_c0_g1_i1:74-559(+)